MTRHTAVASRRVLAHVSSSQRSKASTNAASSQLRAMRAERRSLLQRVAAAEARAERAEKERDDVLGEQKTLYDEGTEHWQNVWSQDDTSDALTFPTNKSVMCKSVESCHSLSTMPGVHSEGAIDKGRTSQSIWIKGKGYTLVGLVTSDKEKQHVRRKATEGWDELPFMTSVYTGCSSEHEGDVVTIEVDMVERRAELYVSTKNDTRLLEPRKVWTDLPAAAWVAVAFKRNSAREAALMPCMHWNVSDM